MRHPSGLELLLESNELTGPQQRAGLSRWLTRQTRGSECQWLHRRVAVNRVDRCVAVIVGGEGQAVCPSSEENQRAAMFVRPNIRQTRIPSGPPSQGPPAATANPLRPDRAC